MFDITILAIGKIKQEYINTGIKEYLKRLSPYAKIKVEELKAESFGSNNKAKSKVVEGERLLNYLSKQEAEIVILDEKGPEMESVKFANFLDQNKKTIFVIGGSLGLSEDILKGKYKKLSLSKMTMPHELVRLVLAEQIYRAATIVNSKEYHY